MLVYVALGLLLIFLYMRWRLRPIMGKELPGPAGWPIVGYALKMKRDNIHELFSQLAERFGDIFKLTAFGKPIVVINSAEMIRALFCDEPYRKHTNDRLRTFHGYWVMFEERAMFATLHAHNSPLSERRKRFTRGMHIYGEGIQEFETIVSSELARLKIELEGYGGQEFEMEQVLLKSLSNVVSILLIGEEMSDSESGSNIMWNFDRSADILYAPATNAILTAFPALRLIPGFYKNEFDAIMKARATLLERYFYETKESYQHGRIRGLVDFYLAEQRLAKEEGRSNVLTDEDICARILETVVGGIMTTLSTLTSLFLCLLNHPEYQTRIQEELDHVIGRDDPPAISQRHQCVITEAISLEAQRYITVAPFAIPHSCTPNIEFQGYEIPAMSTLMPNVWHVHHDEKVWGDPWTFRPERWLADTGQLLPNDHELRKNWLVFGTGRRQCIGESLARSRIFLFLTTLLQTWNLEMVPEHHMSCDPRAGNLHVEIICRPKPYLCRAVPRKGK